MKTKVDIKEILKEQKPFKQFKEEDTKAKELEKIKKAKENKKTKQISLYMFEEEIKFLDQLAKQNADTRSRYLRKYILKMAKKEGLR